MITLHLDLVSHSQIRRLISRRLIELERGALELSEHESSNLQDLHQLFVESDPRTAIGDQRQVTLDSTQV